MTYPMDQTSLTYANLGNLSLVEELYEKYRKDPSQVDPSWRFFFEGFDLAGTKALGTVVHAESGTDEGVSRLIRAYRTFGHKAARINPLKEEITSIPELDPKYLGFANPDLEVPTMGILSKEKAPVKELIEELQKTYCSTFGVEYTDLLPEVEQWIQQAIEPKRREKLTSQDKLRCLQRLTQAEIFETFLHTKFVGQKRFSLEGCESFIPLLEELFDYAADTGVQEVYMGMAHRGRLSVLCNVLSKPYAEVFAEFQDLATENGKSGDVKYHKGIEGVFTTPSGKTIKTTLASNPSHLEAADPVVEGMVRARQEKRSPVLPPDQNALQSVMPLLIHGDAAIAGQGIIYEIEQMCQLPGYKTGGTVHIILNNQIGFTASPEETRSTEYATDIAKTFGAPVFHVNAYDLEACLFIAHLASALRAKFSIDVFIDLIGWRRWGHNEGDEPSFTSPLIYEMIRSQPTILKRFIQQLEQEGVLKSSEAAGVEAEFRRILEEQLAKPPTPSAGMQTKNTKSEGRELSSLTLQKLQELGKKALSYPDGFSIHPKLKKLYQERLLGTESLQSKLDWGTAEIFAYASLLAEGVDVRISGQDCARGTFSHRQAILVDQKNGKRFYPLEKIGPGRFQIHNSLLSEFGVMGFEYGYSLIALNSLVIWEAQFGDFANGAQTIIDQFITSGEQKWDNKSRLVLFLPHGYEGQGPEHSSARIERFLQQCAEDNFRLCNCTTPAQLFHLLRLQVSTPLIKPLVLFTPKLLLRLPECQSTLEELVKGAFEEVIYEKGKEPLMIFCSGKVYYDLKKAISSSQRSPSIVRLEQLYPWPEPKLQKLIGEAAGARLIFLQEEPRNMGPALWAAPKLSLLFKAEVQTIARPEAASPAVGSHALHEKQRKALFEQLFRL